MSDLYVDEEGYMIDSQGQYLVDPEGLPVTEEEFDQAMTYASSFTAQGEEAFVDSIRPAYARLEQALGREPTDRELSALLSHAEETGDVDIDKSYESITGRPLSPNLSDDETRLRVFAEFADEGMSSDESAEAPDGD